MRWNEAATSAEGADHVAIQVLGASRPEKLIPVLGELAGPLGLAR